MMASNLTSQLLFWFRSTYYRFVTKYLQFYFLVLILYFPWLRLLRHPINFNVGSNEVFVRIKLKLSRPSVTATALCYYQCSSGTRVERSVRLLQLSLAHQGKIKTIIKLALVFGPRPLLLSLEKHFPKIVLMDFSQLFLLRFCCSNRFS